MSKNQEKNCELNDYDIISDVLGCQKSLMKLYATSLCEIAEEPIRTLINSKLTECATDQYDAFCYMNERGMYKTEQAPKDKIKQAQKEMGCSECGELCDC